MFISIVNYVVLGAIVLVVGIVAAAVVTAAEVVATAAATIENKMIIYRSFIYAH